MVESSRGRHMILTSDLQMYMHMLTCVHVCTHIPQIKINRTKEMAQWIRCMLWKHGEQNSDSKNPHKSKSIAAAYNFSIWETEAGTSPHHPVIGGLWVQQKAPASISKMESDQGRHKLQASTHPYTSACTHPHTCMHITHTHVQK